MARKLGSNEIGTEAAGLYTSPTFVALPQGGHALLGPNGVQKYDAAGQPLGEPFPVPDWTTDIVVRGDVIYAVGSLYYSEELDEQQVNAQAFSLDGEPVGETLILYTTSEYVTPAAALILPDGRIAVVYSESLFGTFVQFIETDGTVSEPKNLSWYVETHIVGMEVSADGGFIVTFNSPFLGDAGQWGFTAQGDPADGPGALRPAPQSVSLADGGRVEVWRENGQIVAQQFGPDGVALTDAYPAVDSASGVVSVIVTPLDDGRFAIAWGEPSIGDNGVMVITYRTTVFAGFQTDPSASAGDDDLIGTTGNDEILGLAGADVLFGRGGHDRLDGGSGADQMYGGAGDDIYIVDHAGDEAGELSGEGFDQVWSSVSHTLSAHVERLVLTGSGNLNGAGNAMANRLVGNEGGNVLDGGAGADQMRGGLGDDIYVVDDTGDRIYEYRDQGFDQVWSSVSYSLAGIYAERLVLTGFDYINATGNSLANRLVGNDGGNILDGAGGADQMRGGLGDDTYIVDHRRGRIYEYANEGHDTIIASVSYSLAGLDVEILRLAGDATYGVGNGLDNLIVGTDGFNIVSGGAGDDTIVGGRGQDRLTGGAGIDTFVSESLDDSTATLSDRITDLESHDIIDLSAIDADTSLEDDQTFVFVDAFTGHAGQATLAFADGVTTLNLDVDGDGMSDFLLRLQGDHRSHEGWVL